MVFDNTPALFIAVDGGKRYRFYIGRPICSNCGTKGHLASACTSEYCRSCKQMGHATGDCHLACRTCYKDHSRPNSCTLKTACRTCDLWGHTQADCPSELCTKCNAYGHRKKDCDTRHQAVIAASADAAASTDQMATTTGNAAGHTMRVPLQLGDFLPETTATAKVSGKSPLHARVDAGHCKPAAAAAATATGTGVSRDPFRRSNATTMRLESTVINAAPPPAAATVWQQGTKSFAAVAAAAAAAATAVPPTAGGVMSAANSSPATPRGAPTPPTAPTTPKQDDQTSVNSTTLNATTTAAPATAAAAAAGSCMRPAELLEALEAASLYDYAASLRIRSKAAAAKLRALCSLAAADLAMVLNQQQPEDLLDMMADRQQQQGAVDALQDEAWLQQTQQATQQEYIAAPAPYFSTAAGNHSKNNTPVYLSYGTTNNGTYKLPEAVALPMFSQGGVAALPYAQQQPVSAKLKQCGLHAPVDAAGSMGGSEAFGQVAAVPATTATEEDDDDLAAMLSLLGVAA